VVLVFDLDDTLYDELSYVRSGLSFVAEQVSAEAPVSKRAAFRMLWGQALGHRSGVFDAVLSELGICTRERVRRYLSAYRLHQPRLKLWPEARRCLQRFRREALYIVTDGNRNVQERKLRALGLYEHPDIRRCYLTARFGHARSKPSPYCFQKIAAREKVGPCQVLYIADNPHKDFVGIKPLGFRTLRVRTGQYRALQMPERFEAEATIESLDELTRDLLESRFSQLQPC